MSKQAIKTLKEIRTALEDANNMPDGPICDTIWYGSAETLFDYIDDQIENLEEAIKQHDAEPVGEVSGNRVVWSTKVIPADGSKLYLSAPSIPEGWQPIETAPKDGTEILLYCPHSEVKVTGGYFDGHAERNCWIAGGYMWQLLPPTHWMPCPAAPSH